MDFDADDHPKLGSFHISLLLSIYQLTTHRQDKHNPMGDVHGARLVKKKHSTTLLCEIVSFLALIKSLIRVVPIESTTIFYNTLNFA